MLHLDQLGSINGIIGPNGLKDEPTIHGPFGEPVEFDHDPTATNETKRFLGERYDADAGLQYLNARYYDPELSLFRQPDWFEVAKAGVGTNRYAYSHNDPVNKLDPGGNATDWAAKNREYNQRNGIGKYAYGDNDLDRQRNGLHGRDFDWSKGSNSVKIGDTYLTGKQYDRWKAGGVLVSQQLAFGSDPISMSALEYTATFPNSGSFKSPLGMFTLNNMRQYPMMVYFINRPGVEAALTRVIGLSVSQRSELAFLVSYNASTGKFSMVQDKGVSGLGGKLSVRSDTLFTIHTHFTEGVDPNGSVNVRVPTPTDVQFADRPGMVVNFANEIWGYGPIDTIH